MLKRCLLAIVISLAVTNVAIGQNAVTGTGGEGSPAGASSKAAQEVLKADKDRFAAMVKVDQPALEKLLADDLTYAHSSALLQTKKEFIDSLKTGEIKYVSVTPVESDWKVRIYGDMAIVNGVAAVNVVDHGSNLNFRIRYTNVHANRSGAWQMVSWQATRFPQ